MPLKILCAGYGKDEKFEIEKEVKSIFTPPLDRQSWSVSLVKLGSQITVSVDGPDERIRNKSFLASRTSLPEQLRDLLTASGYDLSGAPVPSAAPTPVPGRTAQNVRDEARPPSGRWPSIVRPPAAAPATRPTPSTPSTHAAPSSAPARSAPMPKPPAAPARSGRGPSASGRHARDQHQCPSCNGSFVVTYELQPNEPSQLVAVACPHCWKLDRVEVGESAAIERAYRADKA